MIVKHTPAFCRFIVGNISDHPNLLTVCLSCYFESFDLTTTHTSLQCQLIDFASAAVHTCDLIDKYAALDLIGPVVTTHMFAALQSAFELSQRSTSVSVMSLRHKCWIHLLISSASRLFILACYCGGCCFFFRKVCAAP